jgi:DNA-directed RNA polymerase subunit RPC12/RpoP
MKSELLSRRFICPECGSREAAPVGKAFQKETGQRRQYRCLSCHLEIPAHLGERWGGLSLEDARYEWQQVYRDLATTPERSAV